MFKINDDLSIYVTRGDAVVFNLSATTDNGEKYLFKPNDIVRINIMEKKGCDEVVFQKGFKVEEETETVEISLTGDETKIGEVISKPTDFWYEIELNPFTYPQTIIGYDDETGAKIFKLFPEGEDADGIEPEDIPVVDTELDLSSDRPVQNQAIAYALTNVINEVNATVDNTLNEVNTMVDGVMEELKNVPNAENMANLQSQVNEHLVATDPHNIEDGLINKQVAEEVATDDKVLVVVNGEILKTNVDNIGVRELEASATVTTITKVLTDEWQAMSGLAEKVYRSVAYGNGKYVCVGDDGSSYYSIDGLTWQAMTGLEAKVYRSVTYGDGRFVCVGVYGGSHYSTDGLTWTAMTGLLTSNAYWGVTYGDGRFVCVGDSGLSYYSTDGQTWTAMTGLDTSVAQYYAVTYGNNRFVCVGYQGASYYSTDGLTWQAMTGLDKTQNYFGVTYGKDRFVCVGKAGKSYYSTDGLAWVAMSGLSTTYNAVTYGNNRFVCVGDGGTSAYSTDGETWTTMSGLNTNAYTGVTYGTEFVCVGTAGSSNHHVYETETNTETLQSTLQVAGTLLLTKLYAGQTTVTIEDSSITQDSTLDIYTNIYGVNPKKVTVDTGSITLEFKTQETDVNIKVVVK